MTESKDPSEQNEPNESEDPFAPGKPPPGWTQPEPGQPWEYQQPPKPYWSEPAPQPGEPIGPPQEQIPPEQAPPPWQQPYGQQPPAPQPPPAGQPPAGQWGPPPGQPPPPYGQQPPPQQWGPPPGQPPQYGQPPYGQPPQYGQPQYGQPQYGQPPLPGIPAGVEVGGLGKRLLARIIDALILIPVWVVVAVATWDSGFGGQILGALVQSAAFFAYDTYFISQKGGQTIGKRSQGLRVVLLDTGAVPDQNAAAKRAGLYNFSWIACYVGSILVALSPLFDGTKRKQGWHDKVAKTVVIKA